MNIFKMEVKKGLRSLFVWCTICSLLMILFMSMFPSMRNSGMQELVDTKMNAMPKAILQAFNLKDMTDFTKLNQYFAYVFQYIFIAGCIYAGTLGSKSLIKEESEGTIEFLYAQPVSRNRIVSMKIFSSVTLFFILTVVLGIVSVIISLIVKPDNLKVVDMLIDMKMLFLGFFLIGLVFMSIGFLLSVLIKHLRLAMPLSIGIFFVTYLLGVFSGMIEKLKFLKYFSPFHYAVPADIIKKGFKTTNIVLSLAVIIVCIAVTYVIYRKKDFRI